MFSIFEINITVIEIKLLNIFILLVLDYKVV